MPRYEYKCEACNREYIEQRSVEDPQFFTECECGGTFVIPSN
jgi:putative FmdB family regulatory protein